MVKRSMLAGIVRDSGSETSWRSKSSVKMVGSTRNDQVGGPWKEPPPSITQPPSADGSPPISGWAGSAIVMHVVFSLVLVTNGP